MPPALYALTLLACTDSVSTEGLAQLYDDLQQDAWNFGYKDGEWTEDFGDAAAFGPTFYTHAGQQLGDQDYLDRGTEAAAYDLSVVEQATADLVWMAANLEEVFMTIQGAITWAGLNQDATAMAHIDALLDVLDPIVEASDDYLDLDVGDFAADLYGPTSMTGGLAVIYLQHGVYLDNARSPDWLERAVAITETIDAEAFEVDHYRFAPGVDTRYLYPNAVMMLVLARLYELTGEAAYLTQAEQIHTGIAPLWNEEMALYHSPYSVESQGAQTDEYSTLSSQNYLMLGLMELYRHTGEDTYRDDVVRLLQSIRTRLYSEADGLLVHHWIDGRPASHDDPDYFCAGCNLQTLFILWYLEQVLDETLL